MIQIPSSERLSGSQAPARPPAAWQRREDVLRLKDAVRKDAIQAIRTLPRDP